MYSSSIITRILKGRLCENRELVQSLAEVSLADSALACLSQATGNYYGVVILDFRASKISDRDQVFELCRHLNTNPATQATQILAVFETPHRGVAEELANAGVGFLAVRPAGKAIDPDHLLGLVRNDDPLISMERFLARLCPFLAYDPIEDRCELTVCRACKGRMVLGGARLHEICETEAHLHCQYFQAPRSCS